MAAIYEFANKISCNQAISWSHDNRICFCTDTAIKILYLNCGVNNIDSKIKCHQTSFPVSTDILDIPQFTDKQHQFLIKNLSRDEFKLLSVERVLNPWKYQFETVARTGYASADWSPLGADDVGRSVLATLSQDYRLCLYVHEPSQNEWIQVIDLTTLRCRQTRPEFELKSVKDYSKYKDWCFSQAVTVMKWCPKVFTDSESGQKFMLLATGTKSGHLVIWRVDVPCQNESGCSVMYTVHQYQCQISGILWNQQSDSLIVSYVDGEIHVLKFNIHDITQEPAWSCVYSEPDLMKVSCMCILDNVKTGAYVLLANKEHCMLALLLDTDSHTVISQTHIILHNTLSASGMSAVSSNIVLMMSQDALLQKISVTIEQNEIKLSSEHTDLNLSAATNWVSPGFCLSPNKVLAAFIVRPRPGFDHLSPQWRKSATRVHIRCLDDFSIGTKYREECVTKLCKTAGSMGSLLDVIEICRQVVLSKNSQLIESVDECGKLSARNLKIRRYGTLIRYRYVKQKEDDKKNVIEELEKEVNDLTCMILALFVKKCVANSDLAKETCGANRETSIAVMYSMHTWLVMNSDSLSGVEDISKTKQQLEDVLSKTDKSCEVKCCICSCLMKQKKLRWFCENGHLFDMCCKTLLPVEGVNYRTCSICYSTARPPEGIKEMEWLNGDDNMCTFCDGLMLP
ncbi:general transcription factor 3C polypeptide 4-like isoform X4 [Mercenaria mercenaria]|uniref:general transcription factor 3C polypeptide 4-like isoform X4 n=1 Tax=Mercenaria mercenaria TaxID=6596 RepID=UPI00234E88BA|nr:general transcription factor 3C polypeptide 4-like isoform X4 [Mercenaria mercenaria]